MNFLYHLEDGVCNEHLYGLALAETAGFPKSLLENAKAVALELEHKSKKKTTGGAADSKAKQAIIERLLLLKNSTLDEASLKAYVLDLQKKLQDCLALEVEE